MLSKITIISLSLVAVSVGIVAGIDLIEMSDANKNTMNLALSKALAGVQDAYQNEFKFESVKDVRMFLAQCEYVRQVMSESDDSSFQGLARQIKTIMAADSIKKPCSVRSQLTADFDELDSGFQVSEFDYLSIKAFKKFEQLDQQLKSDEALDIVARHVLQKKIDDFSRALLEKASSDVDVYLGETHDQKGMFDFDVVSKRVCEASLIEPICRLVRRAAQDVTVIAADFDEFAEAVQSDSKSVIDKHTQASGVSMDELKSNCRRMLQRRVFKPIELIRMYLSAGFIANQQVEEQKKNDSDLAIYSSLYDLCKVVE